MRIIHALACAAAISLMSGGALAQSPPTLVATAPYGQALSAAQAQAAMDAAEAEARRHGWAVSIAVLEPNGQLVAFKKLDDASYGSSEIAMGKARTAAFFRRPSKDFADRLVQGATGLLAMPQMTPARGGVPIIADGKIIGAIGVSGVESAQDEQAALAGAKAASEARR